MSDDIWSYYSRDLGTELSAITEEKKFWKDVAYVLSAKLSHDNPINFPSVGSAIAWASGSYKEEDYKNGR